METLNSRYDLKIGTFANSKYFTLFDEKLFCAIYQIKVANGTMEESYPSCNIDNTKGKSKLAKNRVVSNSIKEHIIALAKKEIDSKKIFLVGCGAKKQNGFHSAEDLYESSRITWAKNLAYNDETKCNLFILSAKYGIVSGKTLLFNYDLMMDDSIADALYSKVARQLRLNNVNEILFFKGSLNKSYIKLVEKVTRELDIKLTAIGTGCMGGAKEVKEILKAS